MKERVTNIVSGLFILLFAYTAFSKLIGFSRFEAVLSKAPLIGNYSIMFAVIILALELVIVGLLLMPQTQGIGLKSATTLLTVFTLYLTFMVLTDPALPCSCGGVIGLLGWKQHIFFNIFFIVVGMACIYFRQTLIQKKEQPIYNEPV